VQRRRARFRAALGVHQEPPDLPVRVSLEHRTGGDGALASVGRDIAQVVQADELELAAQFEGRPERPEPPRSHVAGTIGRSAFGLATGMHIVPGPCARRERQRRHRWRHRRYRLRRPELQRSVGGGHEPRRPDDDLDQAVRGAIAKGVTSGVAEGNSSQDASTSSPARVQEAITVAASDTTHKQASFSNFGSLADLYPPGVGITSS
jgi:hypothetical protein